LRWGEAIFFGRVGFGAITKIMTPNMYGVLFSTFSPIVLALLFSRRLGGRWLAVLVAIIVWSAVAINSSRGAWISVGFGVVCFMALYLRAHPRRIAALFGIIILGGLLAGVLILAPGKFMRATSDRFDSFQDLDRDKSVNTRKMMVQKGWRLFLENPLCGIGVGGFTKAFVALDTDRTDVSQAAQNRRSSHNSYIALLAETGLAGTLPFAVFWFSLAFRGYKAAVRLARQEEIWALGIYVGFLMMSLHLWVLTGLSTTGTWVIFGLAAAMIITAGQATGGDNLEEKATPKVSR
jgi:O-antigen ligase